MIALQAWLYRRRGLSRIDYRRYFSLPAIFPGETVEMVEVIANRKLLPLPWLRLEAMIPSGLEFAHQSNLEINEGRFYQNHRSLFSLQPYTRITRRHRVTGLKRGWYRLQSATMTCGDIIGVVSATRHLELDAELLVYPKPADLDGLELPSHSWQGDVSVRRWIVSDPFMTAGVREYRPGDAMNRINWKASARTGTLQVHNEDYTANHRLMIYINFDLSEQMWGAVSDPEAIENALSVAAAVAARSIGQGIETGFGCNGDRLGREGQPVRVPPRSGADQLTTLLGAMAQLAIARSVPFSVLLDQDLAEKTTQTDFLILTAYRNEAMEDRLRQLRGLGNSVGILPIRVRERAGEERKEVYV
jgi:uncharacterized protein (DUF58 family)